jgi:hypothetical protein
VKLSANHTNLSQECAQQSSLKIVPNCIEIHAQKIVLYDPRFSYPLVVQTLLKNSCQLSMSRFLCRSCCTTALKFVPTLCQKSIVRPPRFLCPFWCTTSPKIHTIRPFVRCTLCLEFCVVLLSWNACQYSTTFFSSPAQLLFSQALSKSHEECQKNVPSFP